MTVALADIEEDLLAKQVRRLEQSGAEALGVRCDVRDSEDVAASVIHVITAPDHVAIHDVLMRPSEQPS